MNVWMGVVCVCLMVACGDDSNTTAGGSVTDTSTATDTVKQGEDVGQSPTTDATPNTDTNGSATDDAGAQPSEDTSLVDAGEATDTGPRPTDTGKQPEPDDASAGLPAGPSSKRHTMWPIGTKYKAQGFWEYLPVGYGNGKKWPLLIFLHGKGQNGDGGENDLKKLGANGPPSYVKKNQWPLKKSAAGDEFVLLSVQNSQGNCHAPNDVKAFLEWAAQEYDIDLQRIYITGLSCGGIGIWNYLGKHFNDNLVAAVVPIAGNGTNAWNTHKCALGAIPIWAFHGDADKTVKVAGTNIPLDGLAKCTDPVPVDATKTIYEGVGHNSWKATYSLSAGHDIYQWLLKHTNPNAKLEAMPPQ